MEGFGVAEADTSFCANKAASPASAQTHTHTVADRNGGNKATGFEASRTEANAVDVIRDTK